MKVAPKDPEIQHVSSGNFSLELGFVYMGEAEPAVFPALTALGLLWKKSCTQARFPNPGCSDSQKGVSRRSYPRGKMQKKMTSDIFTVLSETL